jgi:membrane protease YdiL (CAAX protease family)
MPLTSWTTGLCLFVLSLTITALCGAIAFPVMLMTGASPGDQLRQVVTQSLSSVILAMVILGPLIEEIMFRGWLSGTWRAFVGSALFLGIVFAGAPLATELAGGSRAVAQISLGMIGVFLLSLFSPIDAGQPLPTYRQSFPYIFWAQGVAFGLLHFQNVSGVPSVIAILSTLPFVLCAWIWGYARIVIGLRAAVILHAAYNVPAALTLTLLYRA